MIEQLKETATFLKEKTNSSPEAGIVLGSGLGSLADEINITHRFSYEEIPNFLTSTVDGHAGQLIFGELGGKQVMAMKGRFHYYEGYSLQKVTFPIRVMHMMGAHTLLVSNAAGGLNQAFEVGDLMIIRDHINHFPGNPLLGPNIAELGPRFPEMSQTYCPELIAKAKKIANDHKIKFQTGVYIGSPGPTLETPAEYKMFRNWGADSTGMSTVPEVIVARHAGMRCFGISVITNLAERVEGTTTHKEVQKQGAAASARMTLLFKELIRQM
ncbi:MAG: purine-nucleoside phosphorylase [Bacteroidota bacterium]